MRSPSAAQCTVGSIFNVSQESTARGWGRGAAGAPPERHQVYYASAACHDSHCLCDLVFNKNMSIPPNPELSEHHSRPGC